MFGENESIDKCLELVRTTNFGSEIPARHALRSLVQAPGGSLATETAKEPNRLVKLLIGSLAQHHTGRRYYVGTHDPNEAFSSCGDELTSFKLGIEATLLHVDGSIEYEIAESKRDDPSVSRQTWEDRHKTASEFISASAKCLEAALQGEQRSNFIEIALRVALQSDLELLTEDPIKGFPFEAKLTSIELWPGFISIEGSHALLGEVYKELTKSGVPWFADWYRDVLNGKKIDWSFLEVAANELKVPWQAKGASNHSSPIEFEGGTKSSGDVPYPKALREKLKSNVPMLVLLQAAGKDNLNEARDKLRGDNGISAETRDRLNECLDCMELALDDLVTILGLPESDSDLSTRAKKWWRDFWLNNRALSREYGSAKNLSKASYPTALILTCTAVGSFFGQPLAGSIVGGLIAQQMKPLQAAKELGNSLDTGSN